MRLERKIVEWIKRAIAQWIPLRFPSCHWGSSPKHTIYAFINFVLYLSLHSEKNENKQKEARFGPFKLGSIATLYNIEVYMDQICTYLMDLDNFK